MQENTKIQTLSVTDSNETDNFLVSRRASQDFGNPGETINQTITLYNKTDYDISGVYIKDTISEGATYKNNSLAIGGISYSVNPTQGFNVNQIIAPGNSETITYSIIMDDPIPEGIKKVDLYSVVDYKYGKTTLSKTSNVYSIEVPHGEIVIVKTSDKTIAIKGQKLLFQSIVKNTGSLQNTNVVFNDNIPEGTTYIPKSVKIDDVSYPEYDPQVGFSLENIDGKSQKVVTFEVLVN